MGHAERPDVLVHDDGATGEGAAPAYPVDLQGQVLEADGVVAADRTLELEREDQVEVRRGQAVKVLAPRCAAGTRRLNSAT